MSNKNISIEEITSAQENASSVYSQIIADQTGTQPPTPYTASVRLAAIVAKVRPENFAQYLRQLISFDTVPLVLQNLPLDLSADDTIFNAIVRTQHKLLFNEDWSESLTELVKEYYLCKTAAVDKTVKELAKPLK